MILCFGILFFFLHSFICRITYLDNGDDTTGVHYLDITSAQRIIVSSPHSVITTHPKCGTLENVTSLTTKPAGLAIGAS